MMYQYWNEQLETMPRKELEALQLARLKEAVGRSLRTLFYQKRLAESGIKSPDDIKSLEDLRRIPFTTKNDLRDGFPFGFLSIPKEEVVRLHASSGTTGTPTTIYFSRDDL
jgi:phenylacetate-CoA ligase